MVRFVQTSVLFFGPAGAGRHDERLGFIFGDAALLHQLFGVEIGEIVGRLDAFAHQTAGEVVIHAVEFEKRRISLTQVFFALESTRKQHAAAAVAQIRNGGFVEDAELDDFLLGPDTLSHLMHEDESVMHLTLPDSSRELELSMSRITVDGTPALVFIGRDITERERLAKERELLRTESAHRQRLEAIGRLAGGIAHDFNNHIHAIHGHLDLIYLGEVTEESLPHLRKIDAIAEQAGKLTSQLLGYARKGKRQVEKLLLKSIIDGAYNLFLPTTQTGIQTVLDIPDESILVEGDRTQLQQAILNLMINARDAMENLPENARLLRIRAGLCSRMGVTPRPPADIHSVGPFCCICVEDSGPGVDEAIVEQIFEPFFTTKPTGKGTGMGLSMSYGVSREHGGWIQYDRIESGASFTIILPVLSSQGDRV